MKVAIDDIAEMITDKLLESMSREDLEMFFFETYYEHYQKNATDFELEDTARSLGIIDENETLEIE